MSNPNKIADDLKLLVSRFRAIQDLADYLTKVGSIEQAEREAVARKERALDAARIAEASLGQKQADVASLHAQAEAHAVKLEGLKVAAASAGNEILQKASDEAQAANLRADLRRKEVQDATVKAMKELALLNDAVAAKQVELGRVEADVKKIKEQVSALVKG